MMHGFFKYVRANDSGPIVRSLVAAQALTGRELTPRVHKAAVAIGRRSHRYFHPLSLKQEEEKYLRDVYNSTAYWHGTGRYQWEDNTKVDILTDILTAGMVLPHLDKYDSSRGSVAVSTVSLAKNRLYARCYADMHHAHPDKLNRFVDALHAISYFVVRPYLRHRYLEATSHPRGILAGRVVQMRADQARLKQVGRHWSNKITRKRVNPMLAFRAGSDIPGNYGILFGFDKSVTTIAVHKAFAETGEARTDKPISLSRITHLEVSGDKCEEVRQLLKHHGLRLPVIDIEQMETYVSRLPIEAVLGLRND